MYSHFIRRFLLIVASLTGGMVALNAYVDPMWTFTHKNKTNAVQWGFDERQQKTNWLLFNDEDFDGLLLGSSRVTAINQNNFVQHKIFNYSASAMKPSEFLGFVNNAKIIKGKDFDVIYLGLDFFATNKLHQPSHNPPENYLKTAQTPLYRWVSLLSYDMYKKSKTNLWKPKDDFCDCYDRNMVKTLALRTVEQREAAAQKDLAGYIKRMGGAAYEYDTDQLEVFRRLRATNPNTRFVVFTTPESAELYAFLRESGRVKDYDKWMSDLIKIFGYVYDFMGDNAVTRTPENYVDATHFLPSVGDLIALRLEGREGVPADFGVKRLP